MRTQFLTGNTNWMVYGGKWISPKLNNGDFDYWLVVNFINMDEACGGKNQPKYVAEVHAVSPQEAGEKTVEDALIDCDLDRVEDLDDMDIVECLDSYGVYAPCDSFSGNNGHKVLRQAKRALDPIASMFGCFMDGPKNAMGHTGWDLIKGDMSIETALANREHWGNKPSPNMHVNG